MPSAQNHAYLFKIIYRGRGTSFFPVKHEKLPPSFIQDAKNFSVVKPLNSGEAVASPASPVPRPLDITPMILSRGGGKIRFIISEGLMA